MAGPETRRLLLALSAAVITAVAYVVAFQVFPRQGAVDHPSPRAVPATSPSAPPCPTARLRDAARLGEVAWVTSGSLQMIDLATCRQTSLVENTASPPVRFSADGAWLAFGDGHVVPAHGGTVQRPLGQPVLSWEWSPTDDVLAGVTNQGGVVVATPGGDPSVLVRAGSDVGHLSFSPSGRALAIDRAGHGIQTVDLRTGRAKTVFSESDPKLTPEVAGWTPDGRWILYWRGPVSKNGGPLDAVPSSGGPWVNVFDPVLPYTDFIAECGSTVAVSVGAEQAVTLGKQIVATGPPGWSYHYLTSDFSRSWFWPACSSSGRWVAATDSYNQTESSKHTIPRALWLLATDGSSQHLLVPGTKGAVEFPRWSNDGTIILVIVRTGHRWSSPGDLYLVRVDPKSGRLVKLIGPVVDVGSAGGPGGHQRWAEMSDWFQSAA